MERDGRGGWERERGGRGGKEGGREGEVRMGERWKEIGERGGRKNDYN